MSVGTTYAPEWDTQQDAQTGRKVTRLTGSNAEDYHLYFYNPTVTRDNRYLIFLSERTGISNLFRLDLQTGLITQLTDAAPARADYYPFTYKPFYGVGACLPALGADQVFYFVGNDLYAVGFETCETRHLLHVPDDRRPSMLNTGASGRHLVWATWDETLFADAAERTYRGGGLPPDEYFQQTASTLLRLDTVTGQCDEILRRDHFWINHVLIHPTNPDLVLFCHEYSSLPDRMWLLDAKTGACAPIPGQDESEWYEHEFWNADGTRVYFHGGLKADKTAGFCGYYELASGNMAKFWHHTPGRAYGHYNLHPDNASLITDGEGQPGCISRVTLAGTAQQFEVLCRHDSYRFDDDQRNHPHPSFTPDGKNVIFTSNRSGTSNVYLTAWNETL